MKFDRKNLYGVLGVMAKIAKSHPILHGRVAVKPVGARTLFSVFDGDTEATHLDVGRTGEHVGALVKAELLRRLLKPEKGGSKWAKLSFDGPFKMEVTADGLKTSFNVDSAEDLPCVFPWDGDDWNPVVGFEGREFRRILSWVTRAAYYEDDRENIHQVMFEGEAGHVVATNGHRLHLVKLAGGVAADAFCYPEAIDVAVSLVSNSDPVMVEVSEPGGHVRFRIGDDRVVTSRRPGWSSQEEEDERFNFPDPRRVMSDRDKEHKVEVEVKRDTLNRALSRAMRMIGSNKDRLPAIKLLVDSQGGKLVIETSDPDIGEASIEVPLNTSVSDTRDEEKGRKAFLAGVNPVYLLDALAGGEGDEIVLFFDGGEADDQASGKLDRSGNPKAYLVPIKVRLDDATTAVVMPLRP